MIVIKCVKDVCAKENGANSKRIERIAMESTFSTSSNGRFENVFVSIVCPRGEKVMKTESLEDFLKDYHH